MSYRAQDREATAPEDLGARVFVAQRRYGFDAATARRLTFIRWLYVTGRLTDDGAHSRVLPCECEA